MTGRLAAELEGAAPDAPPPTLGQMLSVAPDRLYASGGFFEGDPAALARAAASDLREVYPAYGYSRPPPEWKLREPFAAELAHHFDWNDRLFRRGPSCLAARLSEALVFDNVIYAPGDDGAFRIIYESYRGCDRAAVLRIDSGTFSRATRLPKGCDRFYLGSPGSFNYGHWLIDDLTRLKDIDASDDDIEFLIPSYGPALDAIKTATLRALLADRRGAWSARFIDPKQAIATPDLIYTTPPTWHPIMKSPDAMRWVRDVAGPKLREGARKGDRRGERLYVARGPASGRVLRNEAEILRRLERNGFTKVDPQTMSAHEQAATFAGAKVVVGPMGAALTNAVFSPPGLLVVPLAPEGWIESFYWDLAAVLDHRCFAIYGPRQDDRDPSWSDYTVDAQDVLDAVEGAA